MSGPVRSAALACNPIGWYTATAMSADTKYTHEPVERSEAYEAPSISVIGLLTDLTEKQISGLP